MADQNLTPNEFDRRVDLETSTKFVERIDAEFGDVIVIQHQGTRQKYLMKEKTFTDRQSFIEELNKTRNRKAFNHSNLLHFIDYSVVTKIDKADQTYKIRLFYDYFPDNVRREIELRTKRGNDFTLEEMTYLVYDTISACAFLQERGVNHGDLSPDVILRTSDGHFIIGDKLRRQSKYPQNQIDKFIRGDKLYMSPELFKFIKTRNGDGIDRMDSFKSDVFTLGLAILEAGVMHDVTQIYKRSSNSIDRAMLLGFLTAFESRYAENPLVVAIVKKMLEVEESQRPDFLMLKYSLPSYEEVLRYFQDQSSRMGSNLQRQPSFNMNTSKVPQGAANRSGSNLANQSGNDKLEANKQNSSRNIPMSGRGMVNAQEVAANYNIFGGNKPSDMASQRNLPPARPEAAPRQTGMNVMPAATQPTNFHHGSNIKVEQHPNSAQKLEVPNGMQNRAPNFNAPPPLDIKQINDPRNSQYQFPKEANPFQKVSLGDTRAGAQLPRSQIGTPTHAQQQQQGAHNHAHHHPNLRLGSLQSPAPITHYESNVNLHHLPPNQIPPSLQGVQSPSGYSHIHHFTIDNHPSQTNIGQYADPSRGKPPQPMPTQMTNYQTGHNLPPPKIQHQNQPQQAPNAQRMQQPPQNQHFNIEYRERSHTKIESNPLMVQAPFNKPLSQSRPQQSQVLPSYLQGGANTARGPQNYSMNVGHQQQPSMQNLGSNVPQQHRQTMQAQPVQQPPMAPRPKINDPRQAKQGQFQIFGNN